jgi:ABC-2 type transport system permease protein
MRGMMRLIQQHIRIVQMFWSSAIASEMEYRLNFAIAALSSLGYQIGSLFTLSLFYQTGYQFAGWSQDEAMVVLGIFTLLQGVSGTFLVPNLNRIVRHVEQGTLDFVLLKPVSSQFWLSTHRLSLWGIPDLLFGTAIVIYAAQRVAQNSSNLLPWGYLQSLFPIGFSIMILYSIWFMLGATSIWFTKIYNVTEVLRGLMEAGRYPMAAYPAGFRVFFSFVVPVAFLTSVPAEALLEKGDHRWVWASGLLAISLLWISNRFWRFALRFYTSASS